jgi:hypothetical protein
LLLKVCSFVDAAFIAASGSMMDNFGHSYMKISQVAATVEECCLYPFGYPGANR